jgi:hypothetical protein
VNDGLHYIGEASAVVSGYVAHVLSGVLRGLSREGTFDRLPAHQRAEVLRTLNAIEHAGSVWRARRGAVSGPASPALPPGDAGSAQLTTEEAAKVLGVQPRQMRKLGLAGLGHRLGGRWLFDRNAILAEQQRREAA